MNRRKAKRNLTLSACSFFAVHLLASANNLYRSMTWVDIPAHFLGGVMAAALFYWFFQRNPSYFDTGRSFWITLMMVISWGALTGIIWEFIEFLYDLGIATYGLHLQTLQFGLVDTLGDLLFDLLGAASLAVFIR